MAKFDGLVGLVAIVCSPRYLFSTNRSAIQKRVMFWGMTLQFAFAFLVLKTPSAKAFYGVSRLVNAMLGYSSAAASFVFGDKLGAAKRSVRRRLCLSGSAHRHLHLLAFCDSLLPGHHAGLREGHGGVHAAFHGNQRRGIHLSWRPASSWARPKLP